jgi:hypothetical protein
MSKGPGNRRWCVLMGSLLLAALGGQTGCGRTEFDTGPAAGAGGSMSSGLPQLPATPGLFVCGTAICLTSSQQCCLGVSASGAVSGTCMPLAASCTGASLQCDEPADCTAASQGQGNVCCAGLGASTGGTVPISIGSQCIAASRCTGATHLIVCRQDSDCHGAGVCCATEGLPTCLATCPKL